MFVLVYILFYKKKKKENYKLPRSSNDKKNLYSSFHPESTT